MVSKTRTVRPRRGLMLAVGAVAASALVLTSCSGGGGSKSSGAGGVEGANEGVNLECAQDTAADQTFKAAEPTELGILWTDWPDNPITDTWELFDKIEEITNVRLVPTHVPFSDKAEKQGLLISSGEAPTLIPLVYTGEETQYAASGAVLPLSDYADYMPNFDKYVDQWDLRQMVDNLRQEDGKYYMAPGLQEVSVPVFTLILRKDVFDEVGAGIPETWDEMYEALKKIKEKYPDSYPLGDGFEGQSMLNYAAHPFGAVAGWGFGPGIFWDEDADEFVYTATTEGYKELVEYLRKLADEGLLDTESFTTSGDGGTSVLEKVANNRIFAASGAAGTVAEFTIATEEVLGDDAGVEFVQIAPPGGPIGDVVEPRNFWNGFMITSKAAKDPNLCTYIQFADWLYYSDEARWLLQWGPEGETYTRNPDGTVTLNPEYKLEAYNLNTDTGTIDIQKDLGWATNVLAGSTESRELKQSYNSPDFVTYMDSVIDNRTTRAPFPVAPLNEIELEQTSLLGTSLQDSVDTAVLQFIVGQRDMSDWDAFVSELKASGVDKYVDVFNNAQKRHAEAVANAS